MWILLLMGKGSYEVIPNKAVGRKFPDFILKPNTKNGFGFVIELKRVEKEGDMDNECDAGLRQIKEKNYHKSEDLKSCMEILLVSFCFYHNKMICREQLIKDGQLN